MGGFTTDEDEMKIVESALTKDHVHVVQTGVNSAPATDQVASFQQIGVISQRFQSAGVNLVVAVGQGSAAWPDAAADEPEHLQPAVGGNELQRPRRLHHREELEHLVRRERAARRRRSHRRTADGRTR